MSKTMVKNFQTHIQKSVPFYHQGHELILNLSDNFVKDDTINYEIGASTGVLHKEGFLAIK